MSADLDTTGRRNARLSAVQALYQMEITGGKSKLVVNEFNDHWFDNATGDDRRIDREFFELLVLGVVAEQTAIDTAVKGKLNSKWELSRLDTTLRAIMRCAAYEIMRCFDVPGIVVVDEYTSLANDFFDGKEPGFVNAALEKLAMEFRTAEFGLPSSM